MGSLVVRSARLWRSPDRRPDRALSDIEIQDGRISGVHPASAGGAGRATRAAGGGLADAFDARARLVTAGWWNCHVHLTDPGWAGAATAPADRLQAELDDMLLSRGFTSAVDLGSRSRDTLALIARIESGELTGPHILTAGEPLYPPLGLPFYLRRALPWYVRWALPAPITAAGARRLIRRHIRRGMHVSKLFTGSLVRPNRVRPMPARVAAAAVQESHRRGRPVFTHPSDAEGVRRAVDAGVDVLAHPPSETDATDRLLVEASSRGMYVIPTLDMFARTASDAPGFLDPIDDALRVFRRAGGRVLFGTDVGYLSERSIAGELAALSRCGMTPADILRSLTVEPARLLSSDPSAGVIEVGSPADLTVVSTTAPAPSAGAFADTAAVIVGGRLWAGRLTHPAEGGDRPSGPAPGQHAERAQRDGSGA